MRRRQLRALGAGKMSTVERALRYLARPGATLARTLRGHAYGVFPNGDRRRRPVARLSASDVRALESAGALTRVGEDVFKASEAGIARAKRDEAKPGEAFLAQHTELEERIVQYDASPVRTPRGVARSIVLRRLATLCDANGGAWLSADELRAAQMARHYWETTQIGLVHGSDLSAPPLASGARGAGQFHRARRSRACRRWAEARGRARHVGGADPAHYRTSLFL